MRLIINSETDPYFNMASEEHLLRVCKEPTLMLWRNARAVIIGRNQNAFEQVDFSYAEKHGIPVIRRLSGGGAVFHDLGNINYTFVMPSDELSLNFSAFALPITKALSPLGIASSLTGRNDIVCSDGRKFSGTAQCTYYHNGTRRMMHHGTLLFDADMSSLVDVLRVDEEKIKSKGIKSVRSRVVNIKNLISAQYSDMTPSDFMDYLADYFINEENYEKYTFTREDTEEIREMADKKYATSEWLYGKFLQNETSVRKKHRFDFGTLELSLKLSGDIIEKCTVSGDFFGKESTETLEKILEGQNILSVSLTDSEVSSCIGGCSADDFLSLLTQPQT